MVDGLCPRCERLGRISDFDLAALFDAGKSANEGALLIPGYSIWHTSKHLRSHLGQGNPLKNIHLINLPPHSPIEHVWNEAKNHISNHLHQHPPHLRNLHHHKPIPPPIQQLISFNGSWSSYCEDSTGALLGSHFMQAFPTCEHELPRERPCMPCALGDATSCTFRRFATFRESRHLEGRRSGGSTRRVDAYAATSS